MHLYDGKNVILRPKSGLAFKLIPWLATFYLGPTPVSATFLSTDFAKNTTSTKPDLRFRQGWGQLDDFFWGGALRVGQSWTSWDDVAALPETLDFQGPNGSQQNRQTLVRWARDFQKNIRSGSLLKTRTTASQTARLSRPGRTPSSL
jgi:hypothetical protein